MDTEIPEENTRYISSERIKMKSKLLNNDDMEDDCDAKMTLAVTSDEDSKDSGKHQVQLSKEDLEEILQPQELGPSTSSGIGLSKRKSRSGSAVVMEVTTDSQPPMKRKHSSVEESSDEEDFVGFNEDGEAVGISRRKKIKESPKLEDVKENQADNKNVEEAKEVKELELEAPKEVKDEDIFNDEKLTEDGIVVRSPIESPKAHIEADKTPNASVNKEKTQKDSIFRKPFDMGWKREFVLRAAQGTGKEKGEVYYISPSGKKLRTRMEVQQYLTPGLTLDNFTFVKEPLGFEEEVIRSAKPTMRSAPSTPVELNREPLGKRIPKPKGPKGASPPPQGWTASKAVKLSSSQSPRPVAPSRFADDTVEPKAPGKGKTPVTKSTKK